MSKIEAALNRLGETVDVSDAFLELEEMRTHIKEVSILIQACFPVNVKYIDDQQALRVILERIARAENERADGI